MKFTKRMLCIMSMLLLFIGLAFAQAGSDYSSQFIGTLKYVPAGTFQRDGNAANTSTVSAFRISEKEITRAQFVAVTGLTDPSDTSRSTGQQDPVQCVNWYHALVFCNKLSMLEGLTPVYMIKGSTDPARWGSVPTSRDISWDAVRADWSADGYRLPTEMEWMWAAMDVDKNNSGKTNTQGYTKKFAGSNGSNDIGDYAWYLDNSNGFTHSVGTKQPNKLGLYDMSGNVWEWCWDWYAKNYPSGSTTNYKGSPVGTLRILHGGGWNSGSTSAIVADQLIDDPYDRHDYKGFRIVRP